jgi:futalosine hydrolase
MKIVITAATEMELAHLKSGSGEYKALNIGYFSTGIGALSTSVQLNQIIVSHNPELIIQTGLAGSFTTSYLIGNAVVVKNEIVAEMGVFEKDGYKDIFDLGLQKKDVFPYINGQLVNENQTLLECTLLEQVSAITVNEISTSSEKINLYSTRYNAGIETMEGAALHHVCIMNKIPFLQIRGISNIVGERDKSKWQIEKAIDAASTGCKNALTYFENKLRK